MIELVALLAIIGLLSLLMLPALASSNVRPRRIQCLQNLAKLSNAAMMYSSDNEGWMVHSYPASTTGGGTPNPYCWCPGYAATGPFNAFYGPGPEYTATNQFALRQGKAWPYLNDPAIYKCPSDPSQISGIPVMRSYSMNGWVAGLGYGDAGGQPVVINPTDPTSLQYTFIRKVSQITKPAGLFLYIDEDANSINDGMFLVDVGSGPGTTPRKPLLWHQLRRRPRRVLQTDGPTHHQLDHLTRAKSGPHQPGLAQAQERRHLVEVGNVAAAL